MDIGRGTALTKQARQYRTLNQIQKIYDKFYNDPINPYSSVKVRFKMKTKFALPGKMNGNILMPRVEVGILSKDWNELPNPTNNGTTKGIIDASNPFPPFENVGLVWPHDNTKLPTGGFNSINYYERPGMVAKREYGNGSAGSGA